MGTTKLTRKEILAEDPVHEAIMQIVEFLRTQAKLVAGVIVAAAVLAVGGYFGMDYLQARDQQMQVQLGRALDFYHARIDPSAGDNPFAKGPDPTFKNETAKYQATIKELSNLASRYAAGKLGLTAKYYLGLSYLKLGQTREAMSNLEAVRNNSRDKTLSNLAKKVLAGYYFNSGNYKAAQDLLEGLIRDPQCDLPKDDLGLLLSRVYEAEGKRGEALKTLRQAKEDAAGSGFQPLIAQELNRLEGAAGAK